MLKKLGAIIGAGFIAFGLSGIVAPALSAEETVTAVSCFPIGHPVSKPFQEYVRRVNQRGKGVVKIDLKGGAPAIGSPFTLTQKMSKGVYDMVGCTEAYFGNVFPEAAVLRFSEYTWAELRKNGGLKYISGLLARKNIHYIARHHSFGKFHLWLSKPITGPNLKGLHLRVSPVYTAFFESLGATTQRTTTAQVYTYMENGTVQGYGWPALGWVPAWIKITKYRVEPGFYDASLHTLANGKKWKKLSSKAKAILTEVGLEMEAAAESDSGKFQAALKKQKAWMASKGMETITFTGAKAAKWLKAAQAAGWKEVEARSPKHGRKLKALFTR